MYTYDINTKQLDNEYTLKKTELQKAHSDLLQCKKDVEILKEFHATHEKRVIDEQKKLQEAIVNLEKSKKSVKDMEDNSLDVATFWNFFRTLNLFQIFEIFLNLLKLKIKFFDISKSLKC